MVCVVPLSMAQSEGCDKDGEEAICRGQFCKIKRGQLSKTKWRPQSRIDNTD